ncbi:TPA: Imidazole glycerol phosphate synthase hisHF, chloroplastic [Trebouxia sp. C0004]
MSMVTSGCLPVPYSLQQCNQYCRMHCCLMRQCMPFSLSSDLPAICHASSCDERGQSFTPLLLTAASELHCATQLAKLVNCTQHNSHNNLQRFQTHIAACAGTSQGLAKRVIACLDVRANDAGDLVVTKGDQYDVRDKGTAGNDVRNLGLPVQLAGRYFVEGADEVTFLNITGFRDFPLGDLPMLEVVRQASEGVFVPLTVGGGIREFTDADGKRWSALEVASEYFRSGADKVSIGGDAVFAAEEYRRTGQKTGTSSIEQISWHYGAQALVVSIDPKRVYVADPAQCSHNTVKARQQGPNGEEYCWYQCTVKGGREGRDIDAVQLAQAVEALGAGEILLNSIDADGACSGFDLELIQAVSDAVTIPVIASSGAGSPEHFTQVFNNTKASAALAAGIFHRQEVAISDVKSHMAADGLPTRT